MYWRIGFLAYLFSIREPDETNLSGFCIKKLAGYFSNTAAGQKLLAFLENINNFKFAKNQAATMQPKETCRSLNYDFSVSVWNVRNGL